MAELRFGIPRIDDAIEGSRTLLIRAAGGVDGRPFLSQAVRHHTQDGGRVVYLTTDKSPAAIREGLREAGVGAQAMIRFIDGHAPLFSAVPDGQAVDVTNLQDIERALDQAAHEDPEAMLIVDSLAGIAMQAGDDRVQAWGSRLAKRASDFAQALLLDVAWGEGQRFPEFPDQVELAGVVKRIVTHEHVRVARRDGHDLATPPMLFRRQGTDIVLTIPKVVVTGPDNAGKTTFVLSTTQGAATTERKGTTVAGERGTARLQGVDVELFGTPGQERFDALLPTFINQAVAAVVLVDATRPENFARARHLLSLVHRECRHVVVVASKQDQAGAASPTAVAQALRVDPTHVIGADVRQPEQARRALEALLESLWREATN